VGSRIPPYIAYRTFRNFLYQLEQRGLPARIDRSVMSQKSGTVQSRLLLALNYLGLITSRGRPTERFRKLVTASENVRRNVLKEIIISSYEFLFNNKIDIADASSSQVEEIFHRTGSSGETLRRSISFFLSLAKEAGIPVSPYIKPHRNKRRHHALPSIATGVNVAIPSESGKGILSPDSSSKEILFTSGGNLKMEMRINIFDLNSRDRKFVFEMVDAVKSYESKKQSSSQ